MLNVFLFLVLLNIFEVISMKNEEVSVFVRHFHSFRWLVPSFDLMFLKQLTTIDGSTIIINNG